MSQSSMSQAFLSQSFMADDASSAIHSAGAALATAGTRDVVRSLVCDALDLRASDARPGDEDSLVAAGLSSMGLVALILALESRFDLEVPRREMAAEHFRSVASIAALMARLSAPQQLRAAPIGPDRHAAD